MGGPAELFPWWLWLLCGMWAGTFVLRSLLLPTSDWRWVFDSLLAVYSALLVFMCVGNQKTQEGLVFATVSARVLLYLGLVVTFAGVLLATSGRGELWAAIGQFVSLSGCVLLGILWNSPEFSVVCAALALLCLYALFTRQLEPDPPAADQEAAADHPADPSPSPLPRRDYWVVGVLVGLGCVLWLGLIPYVMQRELQQAGANRWSTALPSREIVARWHQRTAGSAGSPSVPQSWSWGTLLLGSAVVWLAWQQQRSSSSFDEQEPSPQISRQPAETISSDGSLAAGTKEQSESSGGLDA